MNKSLRLFTIKGIDIRVHLTFPLIFLWAAYQFGLIYGSLSGALFGITAISLLFILVTLHELGHSFAARMYGVPVKEIILSPIGGVAQLKRMPESPKQEMVIAIAGPAVNFLMAFLIAAVGFIYGLDFKSLTITFSVAESATIAALISYVFISNLFLAAFNLIPAFPMDGGRIFRAFLALRLDYSRATDIAATVGRIIAILFGIYGFINGGLFLIFIAFFIFMAAGQEARYSRFKHSLDGYTVKQAYSASAHRLQSSYSLEQAKNLIAYTGQKEFPVVDDEWLTGYLTRTSLYQALQSTPSYVPVSSIMDRQITPVTQDTGLFEVQRRLVEESRQSLPVVSDSGRYLGVINHQLIAQLFQQVQTPPIIPGTTSS
jgi:Zn-dependent protease